LAGVVIAFATAREECTQEVVNLALQSLQVTLKHYGIRGFERFVTLKALRCQLDGIDDLYLVLAGEDHDG
jgi:hypothetical protein